MPALIRALAEAAVSDADRRARDRQLDHAERRKWSAMRRELEFEAIAADPDGVASAAMAEWLAAHPEQLDEPEPGAEVARAGPDRARLRGDAGPGSSSTIRPSNRSPLAATTDLALVRPVAQA